ncbi:MAG: hypothetical protein RI941_1015, partial [Pseudomonadota bacterium]
VPDTWFTSGTVHIVYGWLAGKINGFMCFCHVLPDVQMFKLVI